jgi:hypothetical protein
MKGLKFQMNSKLITLPNANLYTIIITNIIILTNIITSVAAIKSRHDKLKRPTIHTEAKTNKP